jgi:hypothetical protein
MTNDIPTGKTPPIKVQIHQRAQSPSDSAEKGAKTQTPTYTSFVQDSTAMTQSHDTVNKSPSFGDPDGLDVRADPADVGTAVGISYTAQI